MAFLDTPQTQQANRRFIKNAMSAPLLEQEHELDLARRWRDAGDEQALHELISSYVRLVISVASKFRNYGLPMGDLVQEGNVGLMQAASRFEPERELRFSTYASWWVRAEIQDFVLRNWSIVRTGTTRSQKTLFFNLRRLRAALHDEPGQTLSLEGREKIAQSLNVPVRDVTQMESRLTAADRSLNARLSEDAEAQWQDTLVDDGPLPDEIVIKSLDGETHHCLLERAIGDLSSREAIIIRERKLSDEGPTLEELGRRLGVSKERVRQIEGLAMKKLRKAIETRIGDPFKARPAQH